MNDTITLSTTLTTTNGSAYASGDCVGGLFKFKGSDIFQDRVGFIQSAVLADKGKQNISSDLIIFNAKPTATTFTNDTELTMNDADITKILGVIKFSTYYDFAASSVSAQPNLSLPIILDDISEIYATLVTRGAPTYTSTSDIIIRLNLFR